MALDPDHLPQLIEPVARELLGEPNRAMSSKNELRYGSHGSLSVDLAKGTFYDHEAQQGGGVLDLITRETGKRGDEREHWIGERFPDVIVSERQPRKSNGKNDAGKQPLGKEVAWYDYLDEAGALLFQVVRFEPKTFRQRRRARADDPAWKVHNGWVWSARGTRQVPYHLPELIEAVALGRTIVVVEGEKDTDNLRALGVDATCNAGGVGKWSDALNDFFSGADVVVAQDNDPQARHPKTGELLFHQDGRPRFPGQDHARDVCRNLSGVADRVRLLDLAAVWPECPKKGDVSNWIASGGTIEQFWDIIQHVPDWSPDLPGPSAENQTPTTIQTESEFIRGFIPPDYLIDGMLQRRFIYSLTGQTGHAKTAVALLLAQQVGSADPNAMFGKHRVEKGRVIYFVGENPDDVRMRVIGSNFVRNMNPADSNIWFIPGVFNIEQFMPALAEDIKRNGEPSLIIIDTSAAYFLGDEEMSNTQMGNYARLLRRLTTVPGGPCVLVLCHPIKHAAEPSQLLPRGGGAFIAEVDGNLTLWRQDDLATLDHSAKFRGAGFQPITFRLEPIINAPTLKDAKGRSISTVHAVVISQKEEETETDKETVAENLVLTAMLASPDGSLASWAGDLGWYTGADKVDPDKRKVHRILQNLDRDKKHKLVVLDRRKWVLTEKGKEIARKAALAFDAERRRNMPEPEQLKLTV